MDHVMSRPQAEQRPSASRTRSIVGAFVAFALSFAALIAMPQAAQAADVVDVPDTNLKAVLNTAIATATSTTRTPDQDITPADALTVTAIDTGFVDDAPIATLTGLEAFTNVTTLVITRTGSTVTDLRPISSLRDLTLLQSWYSPITSLDGLEKLPTLNILNVISNQLTDVSALSQLTQLTSVTIQEATRLKDISALTASKSTLQRIQVSESAVEDISFLEGFKNLRNILLANNRIEDVSVFGRFDDSYLLNDTKSNRLTLSGNRIRDFSPVAAFRNIKGFNFGPTAVASSQSIYVGPYDAVNGVTVPLKSGPATNSNTPATPSIAVAGTGTYVAATGLLTSADPAATFLGVNPNWTINFSEAPDKLAALRVNEVESNGDTVNGDWVELYNPSSSALDLGGLVVSDNDDTHKVTVLAGRKIPAKGYQTIRTDDPAATGEFGLGAADSVRIFAPGTTDPATTTAIDSYTWTAHPTTTYGRTVPGAGTWATTSGGTFGAVNEFPPPTVIPTVGITGDATSINGSAKLTATVTKPDSTDLATDATGTVVFAIGGTNVSGPVTVTGGKAEWTATSLAGSPSGTAHQVTVRYVSAGDADPYDDSAASGSFTVTVTILEFTGEVVLSTPTPESCQPLTAVVSGISPAPDALFYQWQTLMNGVWFSDSGTAATTPTITPGYYDGGSFGVRQDGGLRRVVVTAVKAGHASKVFTAQTTAQPERAPYLTKPAAVLSTTTPTVGQTITATHPEWTSCIPASFNWKSGYRYQWLRDGEPIEGATDSVAESTNGSGTGGAKKVSYTVTPADAAHKISLRVSGFSTLLQAGTAASTETSAVTAGAFTTSPAPVVDNVSPKVGDKLTASTEAWSPSATFAYQWLRDGQPIAGATSASYTATAADADHVLSVQVTGTAGGYASAEKTSAATAKVAKLAFTGSPVPVIGGGTPRVGDKLTATVQAWSPAASFTWQWLRDGQPINGATAATYTVTAADQGRALSVKVTGTAVGYESADKTSAAKPRAVAKPVPKPSVKHVKKWVGSKYSVKVTSQSGKKLRLSVTAKKVPTSLIDKKIRVKVAGVKGSYTVTVKNGKATLKLGSKAKKLKKGAKVKMTVSLPKLTAVTYWKSARTTVTTTYTVAKATKKINVKLK